MRVRDDLLRVRDDMGISGTLIYNIDYSDPISEIQLQFEATNGATHNKNNPIEWNIDKIEVVDGSDVLYSVPGDVALALWMHTHNKETAAYRTEGPGEYHYMTIPIAFGRYLYDPLYAFNPIAHKNPQLRISFDEATIRAAGVDGYVSDSFQLSILCKLMEGGDAPRGFLMAKDVYDFTTVASGDERIDMPTDYPWRLLAVRAYESGVDLRDSVTNYELNCDGGRYIVFDEPSRYTVAKMAERFDPLYVDLVGMFSSGVDTQTYVGIDKQGSLIDASSGYGMSASSFWPGLIHAYPWLHDGTAQNDRLGRAVVGGWAIHNTLLMPFGRLDVAEEWFDARLYNNVRLYLTQGNAGAEVNVCVQQLRNY